MIPLGEEYLVKFEVAEDVEYGADGLPITDGCGDLFLRWGLHREWAEEWMSLPDLPEGSFVDDDRGAKPATVTPLPREGDRTTVTYRRGFPLRFARARFEIPSYYAPLELNFVLLERKKVGAGSSGSPKNGLPTGPAASSSEYATVEDGPKSSRAKGRSFVPGARPPSFAVPVGAAVGVPEPLGVSRLKTTPGAGAACGLHRGPGWVNFALHSARAAKVALVLQWTYGDEGADEAPETLEFALNPTAHRTGDVWHVALPVGIRGGILPMPRSPGGDRPDSDASAAVGPGSGSSFSAFDASSRGATILYGFKLDGDPRAGGWRFHPAQVMFDPRAVSLQPPLGAFADRQTVPPAFMGSIGEAMHAPSGDFGPASGAPLSATARSTRRFPGQEVVYELSVPDFTGHVSSELAPELAGTFAGAVEKLDHVASLGATTILLMPVQASAAAMGGVGQAPCGPPSRARPARRAAGSERRRRARCALWSAARRRAGWRCSCTSSARTWARGRTRSRTRTPSEGSTSSRITRLGPTERWRPTRTRPGRRCWIRARRRRGG